MSRHDVKFIPCIQGGNYYPASNGPVYTTTANTNVTVTWYQAVFCDCPRCRVVQASRRAVRVFGAALDRLARG